MKVDKYGCLVREKYHEGHIANLGDSCAETCRLFILLNGSNPFGLTFWKFVISKFGEELKFVRHPDLATVPGWDSKDFTNDQYLPLLLAYDMAVSNRTSGIRPGLFIPGTKTIISPGVWAASRGHYTLLNLFNIVQGWLFHARWRWSDDERFKGKWWKLERSDGKVQDWLNYAVIYIFLQQAGKWSTLNHSKQRVLNAISEYYSGEDYEPNSDWILETYMKAMGLSL